MPGFGKLNNKCEKCEENCSVCGNDYQKCQVCKMGYYLDNKDSSCKKIEVENCYALQNNEENKCRTCFAHYFLKDQTCNACQKEIQYC